VGEGVGEADWANLYSFLKNPSKNFQKNKLKKNNNKGGDIKSRDLGG